jgi:hypothetical protein
MEGGMGLFERNSNAPFFDYDFVYGDKALVD